MITTNYLFFVVCRIWFSLISNVLWLQDVGIEVSREKSGLWTSRMWVFIWDIFCVCHNGFQIMFITCFICLFAEQLSWSLLFSIYLLFIGITNNNFFGTINVDHLFFLCKQKVVRLAICVYLQTKVLTWEVFTAHFWSLPFSWDKVQCILNSLALALDVKFFDLHFHSFGFWCLTELWFSWTDFVIS